jgi:uncharacterized membrane protein YjdF
MKIKDIAKRCLVTFYAGMFTAPIASLVFDIDWWKTSAIAGGTAVANLLGRLSQKWLDAHPE